MQTEGEVITQAVEEIVNEGGTDAGLLMLRLMLCNAESRESNMQMLYESEAASHERTKAQLDEAFDRLEKINLRMRWMMGLSDSFEPSWDEA